MLWHEEADNALIEIGLHRSQLDPCVYFANDEHGLTICGLYVDDLLVFSQSKPLMAKLDNELTQKYSVKNLGPVSKFLGMSVHKCKNGYFLEQSSLVDSLLDKFGLADAKPQYTPLALDHQYYEDGPVATMTQSEIREAIGSLLWIAGCTRPDIAYAVNLSARYLVSANDNHVRGIKRIMRYLNGTKTRGLLINPANGSLGVDPQIFADADWAGDKTNRRLDKWKPTSCEWVSHSLAVETATCRCPIYHGGGIYICLNWYTRVHLARPLLAEIGVRENSPVQLWCDNQSARSKRMENDMNKSRAKHIDIRYHFIRDAVRDGRVKVDTAKQLRCQRIY